MAACGFGFAAVATEEGELWCWGAGGNGQLGLGHLRAQKVPARVVGLPRVRLAAVGDRHLAVVGEDGALYTCGSNDSGRLGLGDTNLRQQLTQVPPAVFSGSRAVMVACGVAHTVAVTDAGHAYSCGQNSEGQLGLGDKVARTSFTQVSGHGIVMAACGLFHSVVLSAQGRASTFGDGTYGQLGHGDAQSRLVPGLLGFAGTLVTVALGSYHTMAVDVDGWLWACGLGSCGQLGLGDDDRRERPTHVQLSGVHSVACGCRHTLALTQGGGLWAWGKGFRALLGVGEDISMLRPTRLDLRHFAGARVCAISCGLSHSAAVTEHGDLFTWGWSAVPGSTTAGRIWSSVDIDVRLRQHEQCLPVLLPRQLFGGARLGRWHDLREELALAFAMGTHPRLGRPGRSTPACEYYTMSGDLVRLIVDACRVQARAEWGEGVRRLLGS